VLLVVSKGFWTTSKPELKVFVAYLEVPPQVDSLQAHNVIQMFARMEGHQLGSVKDKGIQQIL
jgi:hypothetical protein